MMILHTSSFSLICCVFNEPLIRGITPLTIYVISFIGHITSISFLLAKLVWNHVLCNPCSNVFCCFILSKVFSKFTWRIHKILNYCVINLWITEKNNAMTYMISLNLVHQWISRLLWFKNGSRIEYFYNQLLKFWVWTVVMVSAQMKVSRIFLGGGSGWRH